MNADFGTPISPGEPQKKNTTVIIIAVVAVVVLCCCCALLVGGYTFGDQILEALGIYY